MEQEEGYDLNRLIIAGVVAIVLIAGALTIAYLHSQEARSDIVLPGGITYLGPASSSPPFNISSTPTPEKFTVKADTEWNIHTGLSYPYSFSYPATLKLAVFPKDPNDSVAFDWNGIPVEQNILLNIEKIDARFPELINKPKSEYIKVWYKSFPGLKNLGKMEALTTASGLKGYKAWYINTQDQMPNVDVFLEVPSSQNLLIHLANGRLEENVFNRIVDSVAWKK